MNDEAHELEKAIKHYYRALAKTSTPDLPKQLLKAETRFRQAVIDRTCHQLFAYARVCALRKLCDERGVEYETEI